MVYRSEGDIARRGSLHAIEVSNTVIYDLYGSSQHSLDELRQIVERATGIPMRRRDSTARGGTYFHGRVGPVVATVQSNKDEDDEPFEPEFAQYPVLFRLDRSPDADAIRDTLSGVDGFDFLQRHTR